MISVVVHFHLFDSMAVLYLKRIYFTFTLLSSSISSVLWCE